MKTLVVLHDSNQVHSKDQICYKCKELIPSMHSYDHVRYFDPLNHKFNLMRRVHHGRCHDELIEEIRAEFDVYEES